MNCTICKYGHQRLPRNYEASCLGRTHKEKLISFLYSINTHVLDIQCLFDISYHLTKDSIVVTIIRLKRKTFHITSLYPGHSQYVLCICFLRILFICLLLFFYSAAINFSSTCLPNVMIVREEKGDSGY